jgi:hypothetical protein
MLSRSSDWKLLSRKIFKARECHVDIDVLLTLTPYGWGIAPW